MLRSGNGSGKVGALICLRLHGLIPLLSLLTEKTIHNYISNFHFINYFRMNTGVVSAVKPLDYETTKSYTLQIKASDWKYDTIVKANIKVIDINDNKPVFKVPSYTVTIAEDIALRTPVLTVQATDKDPFGELVYAFFTPGNTPGLPFRIDSRTGVITVAGYLDREQKDTYTFKVNVVDGGIPQKQDTSDVTIRLSDVNDNKPVFPDYNLKANLSENQKPGFELATVKATDKDLGENATIRYRVKSGDDLFQIGLTDGVIKSKKSFDREKQTELKLVIQAYDLGTPSLTSDDVTISVKILDLNDNAPIWNQTDIRVSIKEHTALGVQVATVVATDLDEGENARVSYSIVDAVNAPVAVNNDTGM